VTVYRAWVWIEDGVAHGAILTGWQIEGGPHDGQVIVQLPGDNQTHRLVDGDDWYSDRLSAELWLAQKLRELGCDELAARITEGE
jgi:hypothetical protein